MDGGLKLKSITIKLMYIKPSGQSTAIKCSTEN